eukprot:GGOE01045149.1.p1 GENE.GGOE01045149.1~~GGOE01045149.1.p1  ORF type:complete len:235 (+),score=52.34 GGOE01045149.1:87-707(+)
MEDEFFSQYNQDFYRKARFSSLSSAHSHGSAISQASVGRTSRALSLGTAQFPVHTASAPVRVLRPFPTPQVVTIAPTLYSSLPVAPTYKAPIPITSSLPFAPSLYSPTYVPPPLSMAPTIYSTTSFPSPQPTTTTMTTTTYNVFPATSYPPTLLPSAPTTYPSPPITIPNSQSNLLSRPMFTTYRTYLPPVYSGSTSVRVPQYGLD